MGRGGRASERLLHVVCGVGLGEALPTGEGLLGLGGVGCGVEVQWGGTVRREAGRGVCGEDRRGRMVCLTAGRRRGALGVLTPGLEGEVDAGGIVLWGVVLLVLVVLVVLLVWVV
eukprot:Sspe_Gene.70225::Locus_41457_Transcript_1_1_Confidence_1.000_Length_677::g.70225::m.70225